MRAAMRAAMRAGRIPIHLTAVVPQIRTTADAVRAASWVAAAALDGVPLVSAVAAAAAAAAAGIAAVLVAGLPAGARVWQA